MNKKGNDTKARILALERILMAAEKPLKCNEIIDKLYKQYHISANRKTIYDDIAVLTCFKKVKHWKRDGYWVEKEGENKVNEALLSSKNMDWCTPIDFFNKLNNEFHFVLDTAATDKTAKCNDYFTPENDGLKQSWERTDGAVFCNPPYGRKIKYWVKKAYDESRKHNTTIVLLIPARTDTAYFHDYIYNHAEIRFIRGRLKFTDENGIGTDPAPFPSMVVIYNRRCKNGFSYPELAGVP